MRAVVVEPVSGTDPKGRPLRPGPEQLRVVEVHDLHPGPGEVLVTTVAAGVNRADLLQRQGLYPPPAGTSEVIGLEAGGVVAELGAGVNGWKVGDEVVALLAGGGYASQFVVPAGVLLAPPPGVDLVTAATIVEVAATVVSNMDHANLFPGETLLVHGGAGGIGHFAIAYGKALGCTVAATAGTAGKVAHCRELGADIALDYHGDWAAGLLEATGGRGVDVVLDVIGGKYLGPNVHVLAADGRVVVIGLQGGAKGELNLAELLAKRGTVTATSLRMRPLEQKELICATLGERVWPLYADGTITPAPVQRFPIDEVAAAHAALESGGVVGKLALVF